MKITDYEKVRQLDESNIVLIDGNNGTKTILVSDFAKALIGLMNSKDFISGVNLSELDQIKTLSTNDKFLVGTAAGNKAIGANDALFAILDSFVPKEQRRMIYRGKNLGSVVTEEQKTNIKNGTFKGFFLGDYWTIGRYTWRIGGFDYWDVVSGVSLIWITGTTAVTLHLPAIILLSCRMKHFTMHR